MTKTLERYVKVRGPDADLAPRDGLPARRALSTPGTRYVSSHTPSTSATGKSLVVSDRGRPIPVLPKMERAALRRSASGVYRIGEGHMRSHTDSWDTTMEDLGFHMVVRADGGRDFYQCLGLGVCDDLAHPAETRVSPSRVVFSGPMNEWDEATGYVLGYPPTDTSPRRGEVGSVPVAMIERAATRRGCEHG